MKVVINGVIAFDAEWGASKSQKEFIAHEKHSGLTNDQLIEAHNLCKAAVKAPKEIQEPVTDQSTS